MERTKIQEAIIKTRDQRMALEKKTKSIHDMTESLLKKPTAGKAIQEFCRQCSNFDVHARYHCQMKSCQLWLFRQGKCTVTTEDAEEYRAAVKEAHDRVEKGAEGPSVYCWADPEKC